MSMLRRWAGRHPRVLDGFLAALVVTLTLPVTLRGDAAPGVLMPGAGVTGAGWLLFAAVHLPLVWRRRAPVVVFWTVLGLVVVCVASQVTGVFLIFVPLFALYAVARHRPLRHLVPALAVLLLAIGSAWVGDDPGWQVLIGVTSVLALTALTGLTVQLRRTFQAERARRVRDEFEHQARIAVAAERATLAREVHDIVAHNLAVMVALADAAATGTPTAADLAAKAATTGRAALAEMRTLVGLLRDGDDARTPQPGLDDLDTLIEQVRAAGLRVAVTYEGEPGAWTPGVGLAVYRIVQEALTNTMKHASPGASAQVRLRYSPAEIDLEVTDTGPARATGQGGHGLAGIRERAMTYGGEVAAGPAGAGWRVHARVPLAAG
jgi:signal transduction histidine kinase